MNLVHQAISQQGEGDEDKLIGYISAFDNWIFEIPVFTPHS